MYFVVQGKLSVSVMTDHVPGVCVGELGPGEYFGEAALLNELGRRNATVTADTFCMLFVLSRRGLMAASSTNERLRSIIESAIRTRQNKTRLWQICHRLRSKLVCLAVFVRLLKEVRGDYRRRQKRLSRISSFKLPHFDYLSVRPKSLASPSSQHARASRHRSLLPQLSGGSGRK